VTCEVVIPWRAGCPHREAALGWLCARLAATRPGWVVTVAETAGGPWAKARAVGPAVAVSDADVVVVHDADVWAEDLPAAVAAVEGGAARWAVPHGPVVRLSEAATRLVLDGGEPADVPAAEFAEDPYRGVAGGGIVVLARRTALDVPLDPRFEGWGGEDYAWGLALRWMAGPAWRSEGPLWHLWHPPQERLTRRVGSRASEQLRGRYRRARRVEDIERLVAEAKAATSRTHTV